MPRWVGATVLLTIGIGALYNSATKTVFLIRGSTRPMPTWAGKAFTAGGGIVCIVAALLILLSKDW